MSDYIDIVFDGPPGHVAPGFVEVEDSAGRSIKAGEWLQRDDSYWVLRIDRPEQEGLAAGLPEPSPASTPPSTIADIVEGYIDILSPETARKIASRIRAIIPSYLAEPLGWAVLTEEGRLFSIHATERRAELAFGSASRERVPLFRTLKQQGAAPPGASGQQCGDPPPASSPLDMERMREALRKMALTRHVRMAEGGGYVPSGGSCRLCSGEWEVGEPEKHMHACLAALSGSGKG